MGTGIYPRVFIIGIRLDDLFRQLEKVPNYFELKGILIILTNYVYQGGFISAILARRWCHILPYL